jgi:hypothetical protein
MQSVIFGTGAGVFGFAHVLFRAQEGWAAANDRLVPLMSLVLGLAQLAWLQARGRPVAGLHWLVVGMGLSLGIWGTFVASVPFVPHLLASDVGRAARLMETFRSSNHARGLNTGRLPPTSRQASGEPKP